MIATNSTTTPPTATAWTWPRLVELNESLAQWERSARAAGAAGLSWWIPWAATSLWLRRDIADAIGEDASGNDHRRAAAVVLAHLQAVFLAATAPARTSRRGRR